MKNVFLAAFLVSNDRFCWTVGLAAQDKFYSIIQFDKVTRQRTKEATFQEDRDERSAVTGPRLVHKQLPVLKDMGDWLAPVCDTVVDVCTQFISAHSKRLQASDLLHHLYKCLLTKLFFLYLKYLNSDYVDLVFKFA